MRETEWTVEICNRLRKVNAISFAIVGGIRQESSWPDRYVCHSFWCGFLEFKNVYTPLAPKQKIVLRELNKRQPGLAFIVSKCNEDDKDYSGNICDYDENILATFDGSGMDLLEKLQTLTWEIWNERQQTL